ncbi:MAG: hypothetical protein CL680_20490 [Blastomonas sp.]|nr:hypothetical protein [Blastomonas sp.]
MRPLCEKIKRTTLMRERASRICGGQGGLTSAPSKVSGERSMIERVVRASIKPVMIVSRTFAEPDHVVFAYDASPSAKRALERLANSPLFAGLPVTIVMAEASVEAKAAALKDAEAVFAPDHPVTTVFDPGKAKKVIPRVVASAGNPLLLMGAYGHSPIRNLIVGSTITEMIRTTHAPVLLVR